MVYDSSLLLVRPTPPQTVALATTSRRVRVDGEEEKGGVTHNSTLVRWIARSKSPKRDGVCADRRRLTPSAFSCCTPNEISQVWCGYPPIHRQAPPSGYRSVCWFARLYAFVQLIDIERSVHCPRQCLPSVVRRQTAYAAYIVLNLSRCTSSVQYQANHRHP